MKWFCFFSSRRRHTRLQGDWSSDVCSSDLGAGISPDMATVVAGLETEKEFTRVLLDDEIELDVEMARQEHVTVARRLVEVHSEIGAIVLECTNMPPYRAD